MWVKLDDSFSDHPKILAAGATAGWLWVMGLAYANRFATNGFVPADQLDLLTRSVTHLRPSERRKLATKLVRVGLWKSVRKHGVAGFAIHDYLDYQPSQQRIRKWRKQTALRQKRWRDARRRKSRARVDA